MPTLLKVEGLTKRFGERVAVAGCSLTIAEGEIVVIIGPSGCGKTTFLRCINRLEAPTAGSVVLRDEPIGGQMRDGRWRPFTESELASQRRRIGFVFQRFNLFNHLSALDNVAIGPHRVLGRPLAEARQIAHTIATSALVKTAWAGADPNWGRILAAVGRSGVRINPEKINIYLGEQLICCNGAAVPFDRDQAHQYMRQPAYEIRITLGLAKSSLDCLTCDLTQEYVHINADYST